MARKVGFKAIKKNLKTAKSKLRLAALKRRTSKQTMKKRY